MRIARILTRLNLGGPARQVLAGDPELRALGIELRVFAGRSEPGEGDLGSELTAAGVELIRVPGLQRCPHPLADRRALRFLRRELADFGPDLVHTHASKAGWIGRRAAREAVPNAARVHTFHGHVLEGYFSAWTSRRLQRAERRLAASTDRLIAVSEATRSDLVRLNVADADRIALVRPGTQLDELLSLPETSRPGELRRRFGVPQDAQVILVLGRLAPVKRPRLALAVFEGVAARAPHAHLWFAGDGESEAAELDRAIERLSPKIRERVRRLGNVASVAPLFEEIDLVLQTSSNEGFPVALIEAQAAARPFVSTAVGGVPEIARAGGGISIEADPQTPVGDLADQLCEMLLGLVQAPDRARVLGSLGRRAAAREFTGAALAQRLHRVYESVLAERAARVA